jgi:dihydrofolate reductase
MTSAGPGRQPGMSPDGNGAVRWNATMSLDGFIAGPDDAMDWVFKYDYPDSLIAGIIESTGAILAGRNTFEAGRKAGQPEEATEAFGGAWHGPQFVLTHRPPAHEPDESVTFLSGDITGAVATARAAANGHDLLILGADVARQCLQAALMDDIVILVAPILLGDGVRLFGSPAASSVPLELLSATQAGQITSLHYRVPR